MSGAGTAGLSLKYLLGYPDNLRDQVQELLTEGQLGAVLLKKYPEAHSVRTDKALYDYVMDLKNRFLRNSDPLSRVIFDNKLQVIAHALGFFFGERVAFAALARLPNQLLEPIVERTDLADAGHHVGALRAHGCEMMRCHQHERRVEGFARRFEIERRAQKIRLSEEAIAKEAEADAFDAAMTERNRAKQAAIDRSDLPIPGLGLVNEEVTYNGVPLAQASSAEQLRVSMAMAMAANPQIRVIRITDGSLLDSSNMALIAEMAAEADFQVWVERVDESGEVGVVIEDGGVKA